MAESLNTHFSKKKHSQQVHDKISTSLIIREIQIKATMRHHLIPVEMAIIKKTRNNIHWRKEKLYTMLMRQLVQPISKTLYIKITQKN